MDEFNEHHQRHLVTTFRYVDELLTGTLHAVTVVDSPFSSYTPDMQPVQRKVLEDQLRELRAKMVATLERGRIGVAPPNISACWAFRAAIVSASIALEEIQPRYMKGYGEIADDAAKELQEIATELLDQLERMQAYLAKPHSADIEARARNLSPDFAGRVGALITLLARVISEHRLLAFRSALLALLDRAERSTLEVALFGRVSSGKSSLLDHLLQTDLLPVGVTPVTAFPTRVRYGSEPRVTVGFAEQKSQVYVAERLREFVTEQQNPDNARHVTRVELELPSPLLRGGVVFVDTPGLGSLARRGTAETLAYLPHCDLGLIIVDSGSTLLPEDVTLADALIKAGAEVMVLLTKADLLSPEDRPLAIEYAKHQFSEHLQIDLPVHLISVKGADAQLCDHWAERVLRARERSHQRYAEEALARKTEIVYQGVLGILNGRLNSDARPPAPIQEHDQAAFRTILAELETLRRTSAKEVAEKDTLASEILDQASASLLESTHFTQEQVDDAIHRTFAQRILAAGMEVKAQLEDIRSRIGKAIKSNLSGAEQDLPPITNMPLPPDFRFRLTAPLHVSLASFRGTDSKQRSIRHQLAETLSEPLKKTVEDYVSRLDAWRKETLQGLRRAFQVQVDLLGGQLSAPNGAFAAYDLTRMRSDVEELVRTHDEVFGGTTISEKVSAPPLSVG